KRLARTESARARAEARKTEGIARGIAAFEADLVNTIIAALNEKVFVEADAALWVSLKLDHPTTHAIGIELFIPRGVKRIREIDTFSVAAYFHHLWSASQRLVRIF